MGGGSSDAHDADADFAGAAGNGVGDDAIHANRGDDEGQRAERPEQEKVEARLAVEEFAGKFARRYPDGSVGMDAAAVSTP